jgi:hypothetical protein
MAEASFDIDLEFVHDISQGREFDVLESVLRKHAPKWSTRMRASLPPGRIVDVPEGGLREVILDVALERDAALQRMLEASGTADIRSGFCDLDGATRAICVVPSFHEHRVQRRPRGTVFANSIEIQVRAARLEGAPAATWVPPVFDELCGRLDPVWAQASATSEFYAKAMFSEGGNVHTIGVDFSRYLPGLFALNYFGKPYVDLIGRKRLLSVPCGRVVEYPNGVLIETAPLDAPFATAEPIVCQEAILDHLGRQYFFSRENPDRPSAAPNWSAFE